MAIVVDVCDERVLHMDLVPILQALMKLESQYGPLTSHPLVIDEIMTFISNVTLYADPVDWKH